MRCIGITPKIISGDMYADYYPGKLILTSKEKYWDDLLFTKYLIPRLSNGCPRPATSDHILAFMDSGAIKGEHSFNNRKWKPYTWYQNEWLIGQAFNNSHDSRWEALSRDSVDLSVCYIHLSTKIVEKVALEVIDRSPSEIELPYYLGKIDPLIHQVGMALINEVKHTSSFSKIFVETVIMILAINLLQHFSSTCFTIPEIKIKKNTKIQKKVLEYINNNINKDLSLDAIAKVAHMSPYHFSRIFKQARGVSLHQYVIDIKIEKAKRLLRNTDLPVYLVAFEVGYTNCHFIQIFKRFVGVSPKEFRKNV